MLVATSSTRINIFNHHSSRSGTVTFIQLSAVFIVLGKEINIFANRKNFIR